MQGLADERGIQVILYRDSLLHYRVGIQAGRESLCDGHFRQLLRSQAGFLHVTSEHHGVECALGGETPGCMVDVGKEACPARGVFTAVIRATGALVVAVDEGHDFRQARLDCHARLNDTQHRIGLASPAGVDAEDFAHPLVRCRRTDDEPIDIRHGQARVGEGQLEGIGGVTRRVTGLLSGTCAGVVAAPIGMSDSDYGGDF